MTQGDSPTVARRRVRMVLREARETAGLTQLEVTEEMEWSLSKVIRIENGDVSIAPNDLRPLLAFLRIKDRARVPDLLATAKTPRTRQLKEILRLGEQQLVTIRMFPFSADAALAYNAGFDILFLGDEGEENDEGDKANAVMYRETGTGNEIVEDEAVTTRHYRRYDSSGKQRWLKT